MTKLLTIEADAKTVKGEKEGYMTAIMYLAPYLSSGRNVCPMAELAKCWGPCLNTSGHGGMAKKGDVIATDGGDLPNNAVQRARLERTRMYWEERYEFMAQLVKEIEAFIRRAKRKGLVPVVRLNGTSDIQWERGHPVGEAASIFETFPEIQFYDYTKMPARFKREQPANYHLSLSYSGASEEYANQAMAAHEAGAPLVVVVKNEESKQAKLERATAWEHRVDGDLHDLRFTDPEGAMVLLKAKGRAKHDNSGFVVA